MGGGGRKISSSPARAIIRCHAMGFTSLRRSLQMGVYAIHVPLDKNPLSDYTFIKIRKQILNSTADGAKGSVHPIRLNLNSFAEESEDAYE